MTLTRSIAWTLFAVLVVIAAVHIYWAFGGLWPADNVQDLIYTVIGDPRFERMPPAWMTGIVAALIAIAGWIALERASVTRVWPKWMVLMGSWVLFLVFGLRGLSSMLIASGITEAVPQLTEPFATLDVRIYGPLCLIIAAGFLCLSFQKLRA